MQKPLLIKAGLVALVFVVLLVPLSMIGGIVAERATRQQAVAQEIATSSFGPQVVAGPLLALPYVEQYDEEIGSGAQRTIERRRIERTLYVFPAGMEVRGKATVGEKHRGLFKVRTFALDADVRGDFTIDGAARFKRDRDNSRIVWGQPVVTVALSDPRGLAGTPDFEWAGQRLALERGSGVSGLASGMHAATPAIDPTQPQRLPFAFRLRLQGTQSLSLVPLADDNRVRIESNWPHPRFAGQFLPQPDSQQVSSDGFAAQWAVTALASSAQQQLRDLLAGNRAALPSVERLEIGFIEPIDIYSLSDRALKYGVLFVALTFGCFFLFDVLKRLPIHPVQYALVGLALATFFLLLVALSEHVAFAIAYAIAASACIALLGFYLGAVLRRASRGAAFAAMLAALYGALYGLLTSEDSALLLGASLVFTLIAAAIVLTRNVDWYGVGQSTSAPARDP